MTPDAIPQVPEDVTPELSVMGIVYSEDRPSVIIGQEVYFVGDVVKDVTGDVVKEVTIISITRNEVEFEYGEKRWSTTLR